MLFSFTNAFAGRGVLRSKSIAVGNTRVLSPLVNVLAIRKIEKIKEERKKITAKSLVFCVMLGAEMRQMISSFASNSNAF